MPTRKPKPASKPAKKPARHSKPSAKPSKPRKPALRKTPAASKAATKKPKDADKIQPLDVSAFPPESITVHEKWLCLACVSDVFTRQLELAARTAYLEIKRYTPTIRQRSRWAWISIATICYLRHPRRHRFCSGSAGLADTGLARRSCSCRRTPFTE